MHTYRLTPLGLWNARAAGHDAEQVVDTLLSYSRYAVPHALLVDVAETMARYGRLRLEKHPAHGLVLVSASTGRCSRRCCAPRRSPAMLGARIDDDTVVVHASERGNLKQALLKLGWPAEDFAGYVDGEAHPIALAEDRLARCATTSARPPSRSGTAAPASSCSPAAPARRWSARPRWRTRRRPR